MYRIQTLNNISQQGLKFFSDDYAVSSETGSSPDALLVRSALVDAEGYPTVQCIARAGAGVNNITIDKATEQGICVFNTPGANANAVAELVFIMLGIAARKVHLSIEFTQSLAQEDDDKVLNEKVEKGKARFAGFEMMGKTLVVIGLGKIGVLVANAGVSRGMHVIGYDPFPTLTNAHALDSRVEMSHKLDEVIRAADVISVHVPLSEHTKNLIGAKQLETARDGIILLNYARKGIYDDAAVLKSIGAGKVGCYITDFPSKALYGQDKIIMTPHLGASTAESEENCAVMAVKQIRNYLEYGVIHNSVNFPVVEVFPQETTRTRIIVINRDVPNMIALITQLFGSAGLNIQSFTNESNGKVGYNIIDLEQDLPAGFEDGLKSIENVVRVRVLRFPAK
jgi:D-3-phosphoglycerate dehydrogenase